MLRSIVFGLALAWAMPALAFETLGGDAAACAEGSRGPAFKVTVTGFKDRKGQTRVEIYPPNDEDFLASSKKLLAEGKSFHRVDVPTTASGDMDICIAVPHPGSYAVVVLHDRDRNGKFGLTMDGVGFSRNPKLALAKPKVAVVSEEIGSEVRPIQVVLNYYSWFHIGPIKR